MGTTAAYRSGIDFCLLGPLLVSMDGRQTTVGGPRQTAVLARLMVTPGQMVSMEQLIDSVWDGGEPSRPHVAIRSYVSNLRKIIEPDRRRRAADSILASAPPGYRLAVEPAAVDWVRFQRLIDRARSRLAADDSDAAVTDLRRALSLWTGEPCAGLPTSEVFEAHRLRLTGLYQTAVELLYDCLLRRGEHDLVAAEVEAAILADPLRERLTELGMLALYRSGRQSEALALGRRLRDRLLEELGIDPSPAIGEIELRILNQDRSLDVTPGSGPAPAATGTSNAGTPVPTSVDVARGGEVDPDGTAMAGPIGETERIVGLSPAAEPLVGRGPAQTRMWAVADALARGRPAAAALIGEQGIGKSTLVRNLAGMLAEREVAVIWTHSVADGSGALWPWAQAVLGLLEQIPDEADRLDLTTGLEALAGLGRSVASALPKRPGVQAAATSEIMLAVTRLLERRGRRGPVAVVLEDLHWADRPTITMLEFAVTSLVDSPVALLATWRPDRAGDGGVPGGLRGLSRLVEMDRIDVGPLDHDAILEMAKHLGAPLSSPQAEAILRRTAGNPSFVRELIPVAVDQQTDLPPGLVDTVIDRVDRLHPLAMPVLRAASLFRVPFTADDLEPLHPPTVKSIDRVLAAAVRGGVLEEVDPRAGTYRFRHGVISEVLEDATVSSELRTSHRIIGTHLLRSDEGEASYHLAWSPEPADRAMAARIVLDRFHRRAHTVDLEELDRRVRNGLGAAESMRRAGRGPGWDDLVTDALGFLSWRARVEDRPDDWYDNGRRNLRAAVEGLAVDHQAPRQWSPPRSDTPLRGQGALTGGERPIDRLERSIFNLIGLPAVPAGPGDPVEYRTRSGPLIGELANAVAVLPEESPARLAARIHLTAVMAPIKRSSNDRARAIREAGRLLAAARRRLEPAALAPVLFTHVASFSGHIEADELGRLLAEVDECDPGPSAALLRARYQYPVLLAEGRLDRAAKAAEAALSTAEEGGDPLQRAEARFLWVRHLLWVGEAGAVERSIDEVAAELAALGLPEPLPLLRQRRSLRALRGRSTDPSPPSEPSGSQTGGEGRHPTALVGADRASPAELAFRLARLGETERAGEQVAKLADPSGLDHIDHADLALLGGAAHLIDDREMARGVYRRLLDAGDQLIAREDGSVVLGPASMWAAIVAQTADRGADWNLGLRRARDLMRRQGGCVPIDDLIPTPSPA